MPDADQPTPKPGDYVEVTYRGVLAQAPSTDGVCLADGVHLAGAWLPAEPYAVRVVEPPEPTVISTIVTGWVFPDDDRPASLNVYVLTATDADGDGYACWQTPGGTHEYRWSAVLEATKHGRRVIGPPSS